MRVPNKVAVITGGASGIGAASASLLAREGASIAILDRNVEAAAAAAGPCGGLALGADVRQEREVQSAIEQIAARFGRIDILLNAAGIAIRRPVDEMDEADWNAVLDASLKGTFLCSKHALRLMSHGGSIINMSSVTGITGVRSRAAYSAAKGAIVALTRNMALDYAPRNIRVNCLCPGFVRTPLTAALTSDPDRARRLTALHPLGRLGEPEDIAQAVLFLASDESSWITGHALVIDGGFSAGHANDI